MRKLIIPPVSPEGLYFQDKRRRERDEEDRRIRNMGVRLRSQDGRHRPLELIGIERRVIFTTDDPVEAFDILRARRATGEMGWDMAEVRQMEIRPRTIHLYCVFRDVPTSRQKHGI